MRTFSILFLLFCSIYSNAGSTFQQNKKRHKGYRQDNGTGILIIKTDLFPTFNTILEDNASSYNLSTELCRRTCYSLQFNFNLNNEKSKTVRATEYEPGAEIRWYFESSDISFLHLGLYTYLKYKIKKIEPESPDLNAFQIKELIPENGIAGGYRVLLGHRLEMNIVCYLGYIYRTGILSTNNSDYSMNRKLNEINARISLCLGYLL